MRKEDMHRLQHSKVWTWRNMEKICWIEHNRNQEVMETIGEGRALMHTTRASQREWIGHMERGDWMLRTVIEENRGNRDMREA